MTAKPKIVLIVSGGCICDIMADQECDVLLIDYDIEDMDGKSDIPQRDGTVEQAMVCKTLVEVIPERVDQLFKVKRN
jgi:hypothetical protein